MNNLALVELKRTQCGGVEVVTLSSHGVSIGWPRVALAPRSLQSQA